MRVCERAPFSSCVVLGFQPPSIIVKSGFLSCEDGTGFVLSNASLLLIVKISYHYTLGLLLTILPRHGGCKVLSFNPSRTE